MRLLLSYTRLKTQKTGLLIMLCNFRQKAGREEKLMNQLYDKLHDWKLILLLLIKIIPTL